MAKHRRDIASYGRAKCAGDAKSLGVRVMARNQHRIEVPRGRRRRRL